MKPKNAILVDLRHSSLPQSHLPLFRIRSLSKQKIISGIDKSKQKDLAFQTDQQKHSNKFNNKIKCSHKELKKILVSRLHQRQKSQDINFLNRQLIETLDQKRQNKKNKAHQSSRFPATTDEVKKNILYEGVKTEESNFNIKNWIDINSIDTSEDIKILDRIANLCDPFRIIGQSDSKARLSRKSEQYWKKKSISAKKYKLADKINTLVFQIAKSKSKKGFKIHRNKFQSVNSIFPKQAGQSSTQKSSKQKSPKHKILQSSDPSSNHEVSQKKIPKELQISSQLQKASFTAEKPNKNSLYHSQKYKAKVNLKQMKQNNKNDLMQKFWSEIDESLILAAQEEYVSKDLNELLYNNMA